MTYGLALRKFTDAGITFDSNRSSINRAESRSTAATNVVPKFKSIFTKFSQPKLDEEKCLIIAEFRDEIVPIKNPNSSRKWLSQYSIAAVQKNTLDECTKESIIEEEIRENDYEQVSMHPKKRKSSKQQKLKNLGVDSATTQGSTKFGCGSMIYRMGGMDRMKRNGEQMTDRKIAQDFNIKSSDVDW